MIQNARIAFIAGIHRTALADLRRLTPLEIQQLIQAAEEFLADGHVTELRALQAEAPEFQDPLAGFDEHPDHVEVREAMRAAAVAFNVGYMGMRFGIEIDVDETFGPLDSQGDEPRPTCIQYHWVNGVLHVEVNKQLKTFEAGEPAIAEYLIADVLDDSFDEEVLVGRGLRENELDFRIKLTYQFIGKEAQNSSK